jgi:hypothetical protein
VHRALSLANKYELVELCTRPDSPPHLLGFDVGYWGGGNFSILCDAAIWPRWHPPIPDAIPDLVRHVEKLNGHGLFPSAASATAFAEWYSSQDWAEREPEGFHVIAVGSLTGDAG